MLKTSRTTIPSSSGALVETRVLACGLGLSGDLCGVVVTILARRAGYQANRAEADDSFGSFKSNDKC